MTKREQRYRQVLSDIETKRNDMKKLLDAADGRDDLAMTADELKSYNEIKTALAPMEAERDTLKSQIDDEKTNTKSLDDYKTAVTNVPHGEASPDETKSFKPVVEFPSIGALKHITGYGTRQENETKAYRFAQFLFASMQMFNPAMNFTKAAEFCKNNGIPVKVAMSEGVNEQGGALVPPEFDSMLIRLIETYGVFRRYTKVVPMGSDTRIQPRRTGGVTAYWVGEGASITTSRPTFDNIQLVAKKLAALCPYSCELNEDSAISIADDLAFEIGYSFALAEDQAGFLGDGTSTYGGITGVAPKLKGLSGTIANIAGLYVATGNLFSEFTLADFNNVVALLPQYADSPNTGWFCHKSFYHGTMHRLELAAGGVTANEIATGDRRPRPLFLGYPVNFTQVMPRTDANSQVAALFGDLMLASKMGDRRTRTLFTDPYSLSANDQIQIRGTERVDIVVHDVGNADATAANRVPGPMVGLISAAS